MTPGEKLQQRLQELTELRFAPLDILPEGNLPERMLSLLFDGVPAHVPTAISRKFVDIICHINELKTSSLKVVVFGGGTGLSNIIGGDSRRQDWRQNPFRGLKEIFPHCHSIVCITDDGGSTGELLKDLPLIALGDLRHVLLSSVTRSHLETKFHLNSLGAEHLAIAFHGIFNYRFISAPIGWQQLLQDSGANLDDIPVSLLEFITSLLEALFTDKRLSVTLQRPQCLGNLLLAAAIYRHLEPSSDCNELTASYQIVRTATIRGLAELCQAIGLHPLAILPCTTTAAQLQVLYSNGVQVTGESKSSYCRRGFPVDRVFVEFSRKPFVQPEVMDLIAEADILLFAPGSLYSSIIPIMQTPGIASAIRKNFKALKLLVANIWVQKGETDVAPDAPDRKFYVSDLVQAYQRNIPGGVKDLFSHILSLNLAEIPGSVLQRYALEEKEPIYLDRKRVRELGLEVIAAPLFSRDLLGHRRVIQHDADALALAIQALYSFKTAGLLQSGRKPKLPYQGIDHPPVIHERHLLPCLRYSEIVDQCQYLRAEHISLSSGFDEKLTGRDRKWLMDRIVEIVWRHPDILMEHLQYVRGISLVEPVSWKRCQQWDNVFSFFDPQDQRIKIRQDQVEDLHRFEMAFLVALGQSLLGNYAQQKEMTDIDLADETVGRMYNLTVCEPEHLRSFFDFPSLGSYLQLACMRPSASNDRLFTRVINNKAGFTPPGLFFGLFYAWYLDNRFAPNIEYKMSIMKYEMSDLIPEQIRICDRRQQLIQFFRTRVFLHQEIISQ